MQRKQSIRMGHAGSPQGGCIIRLKGDICMSPQHGYTRLEKIYALYDDVCAAPERFCRKGCALCCTANVTLTTLEAGLILAHWQAQGQPPPLADLEAAVRRPRFRPTLTINGLAELCAQGKEVPDETADPGNGPCPLLKDDLCSVYAVRPFGCRAMQSQSDCGRSGAADMPEWILSTNTLFLQYIEAADIPGISGNLADILLFLSVPGHFDALGRGARAVPPKGLPANRSIPVLMIPPEHRQRLMGLAQALQQQIT
ncbi:MAG: YkgJ family cysteine cluster protein [Desulfobacteraceae bacterium]|nr:MAG: YkgJ family cysteine cluster protein [Desulfobacteraceae bacterium]